MLAFSALNSQAIFTNVRSYATHLTRYKTPESENRSRLLSFQEQVAMLRYIFHEWAWLFVSQRCILHSISEPNESPITLFMFVDEYCHVQDKRRNTHKILLLGIIIAEVKHNPGYRSIILLEPVPV